MPNLGAALDGPRLASSSTGGVMRSQRFTDRVSDSTTAPVSGSAATS